MQTNAKLREILPVVGVLSAITTANVEKFTNVIDMANHLQVVAVLSLGDMASETIDFKCYTCDSDGSNPTALTSATQLAASASANDNKQIVMNVRSGDLLATSKQYIKFGLVTGGATGGPACVVVLAQPRQGPAADQDLSSVVQLVG
jgi:hypothetical protein